jgi:hypothetical protein
MITQEQLSQIGHLVAAQPLSESVIAQLRSQFPQHHFTYCTDDDVVAARPVHQGSGFNLYLVDGRGHCLRFTQEMECATGLVVAEIEEA